MKKTRLIIAGRLIDGTGNEVRRGVYLTVKNGEITAINSIHNLPVNSTIPIDDFSHCTLLPALVDSSVSLTKSPSIEGSIRLSAEEGNCTQKLLTLERHIHYCHSHGVLGVADSSDVVELLRHCHGQHLKSSKIDIRTSSRLCLNNKDCLTDNSTDFDYFIVTYSSSIEYENSLPTQVTHKELSYALQHKAHKKAVVIANGAQHVEEALDAGCDAIEQGFDMGEDNLRKMAEWHVLWIPNIVRAKNGLDGSSGGGDVCCRFSTRYVAPGKPIPGAKAFWGKMLDNQLKQLRLARELGVKTAVGTGAGSVGILHGESMVEEIKLFIKAGYSLEEAIHCASENGARFFNMENLGTLTVGNKATFLITRGTVKQLPRKLAYLENIYVDGIPSTEYSKHPLMR